MKANLDPNQLLKPDETADMLAMSESELKKMRQRGEGPDVVQVSPRLFRYRYSAIVRYLNQNTIRNTT